MYRVSATAAPSLPLMRRDYDPNQLEQVHNSLRLYFNQIDNLSRQLVQILQQYYGEFSKTTDQSPVTINTEALLTFDVTRTSNGVIIGTPTSRIVVPASGFYQFSATMQISSGDSSTKNMWVWFKKNGTAIPDSARIVTSDINNGYTTLALVESVSLNANDYVEMAFAADSTNIKLDSVAATAFAPVAPAIVLQVTQVQQ